jgi:hypothetical protein
MGMIDDNRKPVRAPLGRAAHRAQGGVLDEGNPLGRVLAYSNSNR